MSEKWTDWQKVPGLEFDDVIYEKKYHKELEGGVARITINRPNKLNSFTAHTQDEMFKAFYDAGHDPAVGVVVLTGAGDKAFSAGGDVEWEKWGLREQFYWRYEPNRLVTTVCRKPVIAAIKGWCIGGGNHLAYTCDLSIAADNAKFGQNGPRVASPADGYCVSYSARILGMKKAKEMWMLCRRYDAQQALQMGLVNAVVPLDKLDEEVDKWCEEMLMLSPGCLEILKATFDNAIAQEPKLGVHSSMLYPDWFDGEESKEGVQAFLEKRKPNFWKIRKAQAKGENKR